jgi:N-acyl-phosphatidylethanolamine-hydrolysing phospholipase D
MAQVLRKCEFTDEAICLVTSLVATERKKGPHHAPSGFRNVHVREKTGFLDFLKWRWERFGKDIPGPEAYSFPLGKNYPEFLRSNRTLNKVTWIGHATLLLQMDGLNLVTDPQFSPRASPFRWLGPKRVAPVGLELEDLPDIDLAVISHNHYDSLDKRSIVRLVRRSSGGNTMFLVPLGLRSWFFSVGIRNVVELDWRENARFRHAEIIAVPAQHWSQRGFSRNESLWAGWVIRSKEFSFFFVGDSGYTEEFREIGRNYGPFDLAAIPIGAYEPRWFMRFYHMTPEEAVQVHLDVRAKRSIGIHWGTFMLTDEPLDEPPLKLRIAMDKRKIPESEFVVVQHGETMLL